MSATETGLGRGRGRPKKGEEGGPPGLSLMRTPRRCLGFGEDHYFMSAGRGNRRCAACEDKFRKLGLGMRFDRAAKDPGL